MQTWKTITIWILGIIVLLLFLAMLWYRDTYSMDVAKPHEVNDSTYQHHLLIATQGSPFKDSVVREIIREYSLRPVYIKVIDVSALPTIEEQSWHAIVVVHTWENWKPQRNARDFVERAKDKKKLIVLSTSGAGRYHLKNVDAITSSSKLSEASMKAREIKSRIDGLLYGLPARSSRVSQMKR